MKKALAIGFAGLLAILFLVSFIKKDVSYKEITLTESEINSLVASNPSSENPLTGMGKRGIKTEAIIVGQAGQRIEIVSVRKSENVGIDVFYKMTNATDSSSDRPAAKVSFMNPWGKPVGFIKVN